MTTTLSVSSLRALTAALMDDPFYRAVLSEFAADQERYGAALCGYLDIAARQAAAAGKLIVSDPPKVGAALWLLPIDETVAATARSERLTAMERLLGRPTLASYKEIVQFMGTASASLVDVSWWYLSIAGVEPSLQSLGHGSRLLTPTLAEADAQGAICWLQSFTPRNYPFYERLGFRKIKSIFEPCVGHDYAVMVRKPRPTAPGTGAV